MNRALSTLCATVLASAVLVSWGCGGNDTGESTTEEASPLGFASHSHRNPFEPPKPSEAPAPTATVDAGADTAPAESASSGATTPPNVQAVIAAAQTPDGTAIPQGPGPNGECPEVLVLVGFWACPQTGDTCSYQASSVTHNCECDRPNGEGGDSAWVCSP
jgi:hypothetical protein